MAQILAVLISVFGASLFSILAILGGLWRILTWVAVWRSADNYAGPRYWVILAKVMVLIAMAEWGLQMADVVQE